MSPDPIKSIFLLGHDVIVDLPNGRRLELIPRVVEHSSPRTWKHPLKGKPTLEVVGLENVRLYADENLFIDVRCHPAWLVVKLAPGYFQRFIARQWHLTQVHLRNNPGIYPDGLLRKVVAADPDLLYALDHNALPVDPSVRRPNPINRLIHNFPGRINDM